jgi:4-amino-4-deoxy-L-arabinose transferase-like glycosyltransferase
MTSDPPQMTEAGSPPNIFGPDISARTFKDYLLYLFLLGLIVRAGFLVEHARSPSFGVVTLDQKYYDTAARLILAGANLHVLHGLRPMLYPIFLAGLYKLGGSHGIDLAILLQHLLGILTGLAVAFLGARLFKHRLAGLAAGALYLLAPIPLCFEGELLVESSYTFLICLGLLLVLRAECARGRKAALLWLLCGAFTVFTAQERSNIFVFMAVYPLLAAWHWRRLRQWSALLPLLALLGGAAMGIPWGFVNKLQSDHFQFIPSAGGVNLYLGNQRATDGIKTGLNRFVNYNEHYDDPGEVWAREEYDAAMRAEGRQPDANPLAISRYWTGRTLEEIKADPAAWVRLMARKCWLMLWNTEVPNNKSFAFMQTEYAWLRWLPVRWVVLLMFAPAGIWAAARWGNRAALFVLLFYVFIYTAVNLAFFICDRYRYPIWPAMAAIAGGGLLALVGTIRERSWPRTFALAAGMGVMALISVPNWIGAKLPTFGTDYLLRSIAWYEKGHFTEALADVNRSIALIPRDTAVLHHRGNVLLALNQFDAARQDYEETLKIIPGDSGVWNNYGIALNGLGRTNEALRAFYNSTECQSPSENGFLGLAFEQIRFGRIDDAAATLDRFQKLETGPNAVALIIRSVIAQKRGDVSQARALEAQARALDADAADWAIQQAANQAQNDH